MITVKLEFLDRDIEQLQQHISVIQESIDEIRQTTWILQSQDALNEKVLELGNIRNLLEEESSAMIDMVHALIRVKECYIKAERIIIGNSEYINYPRRPNPEVVTIKPVVIPKVARFIGKIDSNTDE